MGGSTAVNFVGHAIVAARCDDHPDVVLGAVAPDLLPRSGARPALAPAPALEAGRRLHHRADAVFHHHPVFVAQQRLVLDALTARGVPRGAARASAHLGIELLLDGALVERGDASAFGDVWERLAAPDAMVRALVEPSTEATWCGFLAQFTAYVEPHRYAEPAYTAARIERILSWRPRLVLSPEHTPHVLDALATAQPEVVQHAAGIVDDVHASLVAGR
jgi:hypothetical protein